MSKYKQLLTSLLLSFQAVILITVSEASANVAMDINADWRFTKQNISSVNNVLSSSFDDTGWKKVNLPHDWSIQDIEGTNSPFDKNSVDQYDTGYTQGGIGWYRKKISLDDSVKDQVAILEFGGVYMNSTVYINGKHVGGQHYGYTSFWLDITKHLNIGEENIIVVNVNNNHLNSRWYSGSGIYRPVSLIFKPKLHIKHWGTAITTPKVDSKKAQVSITTELALVKPSRKPQEISNKESIELLAQLIDDTGRIVATKSNWLSKAEFIDGDAIVHYDFMISDPNLWSPEQPYLYTLQQVVKQAGKVLETTRTPLGIRALTFSAQQGVKINGQPLRLKGMNIHHGHYLLGAQAYKSAEVRKVKKILAAGYNAVRTAHNPPSKAFLAAADEFGLLVINEAFDAWNKHKWDHVNDYASHFSQDWQRDLTNFIKRDRNHPSVIMWSLGNEIPEQNEKLGAETAAMLKAFVLAIDSSREVTIGANTSGEIADPYLQHFAVVGYNYQEMNYLSDHERFPKRVMYGSETYSNKAFEYWQYVEKYPFIIGDFVWTGWDYLGEASIGWTGYAPEWKSLGSFPWTLAYSGELDALGFKRPSAYYRDVLWNTGHNQISAFVKSPTPSLQPSQNPTWYLDWVQPDIHPSWTWPGAEGKLLEVEVYSARDSVELFLNGKSYGKKSTSRASEFKAKYQIPYTPGQLKAVGYHKGVAIDEWLLTTASSASTVKLVAEQKTINADGKDLVYISAELFDEHGNRVYHWHEDIPLTFNVTGAGRLIALGNANPRSVESFTHHTRETFRGRVVAVIQSIAGEKGEITINATAKGLSTGATTINSL